MIQGDHGPAAIRNLRYRAATSVNNWYPAAAGFSIPCSLTLREAAPSFVLRTPHRLDTRSGRTAVSAVRGFRTVINRNWSEKWAQENSSPNPCV
jgi:hypothetical protein